MYGLGIWPMVRPHCISSSVRFPSHFDPVKKPAVQSAQGQVDDERDVGEVAPKPVGDSAFHPRQRREEVQATGQRGPGIGQLAQRRREVAEVVDERFLGLLDRGGGDGAELAHLVDRVDQRLPGVGQDSQRLRDRRERLVDHRVLVRHLADQRVETVDGRDDVVRLFFRLGDEDVQLGQQAAHLFFAPGQRRRESLCQLLNMTQAAAVEQNRHRRQGLLGGRVGRGFRQRNHRAVFELSLRRLVFRRRQLDVHGAQQAGLADLGGAVRRQVNIAVDPHGHQGMPVLDLDLGDVADVDVGNPHPGIRLNDDHIGQLSLNRVRALALPWVPGSGSELRPRHPPQLVSKHKHEMASAADTMRLTVYLPAAAARPRGPSSPAAPRGGRSNGRRPAPAVRHHRAVLAATTGGGCVYPRAAGRPALPAAVCAG